MKKEALERKIKEALKKDFNLLYREQFTKDWEAQREVRALEIGIMDIFNLMELYSKNEQIIDDFLKEK